MPCTIHPSAETPRAEAIASRIPYNTLVFPIGDRHPAAGRGIVELLDALRGSRQTGRSARSCTRCRRYLSVRRIRTFRLLLDNRSGPGADHALPTDWRSSTNAALTGNSAGIADAPTAQLQLVSCCARPARPCRLRREFKQSRLAQAHLQGAGPLHDNTTLLRPKRNSHVTPHLLRVQLSVVVLTPYNEEELAAWSRAVSNWD